MADLSDALVAEAVEYLDELLDEHAVRFAHLERGDLVERIERIREAALSARLVLTERRSLRVESHRFPQRSHSGLPMRRVRTEIRTER